MEHDQIQSYGYEYPNSSSTAPSSSEQFPNKSNREGTRVIYEASNKEGRSNFIPRNNPSTISSSSSQVDQPLSDNNAYAYKNGDPRTSTEIPQDHAISYAQQQEYHENQAPQDQTHYPQQQQHDQEPPRSHIHDPEYNDPVSTSGLGSRFVEPDRLDRDIPPQPQQHYEHDHQSRHNNNQEYDRILTDRDIMESLPEGVQLPPSVDSDLLGERLLNMLLQVCFEYRMFFLIFEGTMEFLFLILACFNICLHFSQFHVKLFTPQHTIAIIYIFGTFLHAFSTSPLSYVHAHHSIYNSSRQNK